jgi:flagellar basal body-associated protein FliL
MTASCKQLATGIQQRHEFKSARPKSIHIAIIVIVTLGALAATGLFLWLLSVVATSNIGVYLGA